MVRWAFAPPILTDLNRFAGDDNNTIVMILVFVGCFVFVVVLVAIAYHCRVRRHENRRKRLLEEEEQRAAQLNERLLWISVRAIVGQPAP
jgi:heme/copper-type cytochrome/quinol oxidase subunit 2